MGDGRRAVAVCGRTVPASTLARLAGALVLVTLLALYLTFDEQSVMAWAGSLHRSGGGGLVTVVVVAPLGLSDLAGFLQSLRGMGGSGSIPAAVSVLLGSAAVSGGEVVWTRSAVRRVPVPVWVDLQLHPSESSEQLLVRVATPHVLLIATPVAAMVRAPSLGDSLQRMALLGLDILGLPSMTAAEAARLQGEDTGEAMESGDGGNGGGAGGDRLGEKKGGNEARGEGADTAGGILDVDGTPRIQIARGEEVRSHEGWPSIAGEDIGTKLRRWRGRRDLGIGTVRLVRPMAMVGGRDRPGYGGNRRRRRVACESLRFHDWELRIDDVWSSPGEGAWQAGCDATCPVLLARTAALRVLLTSMGTGSRQAAEERSSKGDPGTLGGGNDGNGGNGGVGGGLHEYDAGDDDEDEGEDEDENGRVAGRSKDRDNTANSKDNGNVIGGGQAEKQKEQNRRDPDAIPAPAKGGGDVGLSLWDDTLGDHEASRMDFFLRVRQAGLTVGAATLGGLAVTLPALLVTEEDGIAGDQLQHGAARVGPGLLRGELQTLPPPLPSSPSPPSPPPRPSPLHPNPAVHSAAHSAAHSALSFTDQEAHRGHPHHDSPRLRAFLALEGRYGIKRIVAPDGSKMDLGCSRHTQRCPTTYIGLDRRVPPCCREKIAATIHYVSRLLTSHGIMHWADYSTLLGAVRHGGSMVPWDYDADLTVLIDHWSTFMALEEQIKADGHLLIAGETPYFARVFFSPLNGNYVDIYSARDGGDGLMYLASAEDVDPFPRHFLDPLDTVQFEGGTLPAPNNVRAFLDTRYGTDWPTTAKVKAFDGYRRPSDFITQIQIQHPWSR